MGKYCPKCHTAKPVDAFYVTRTGKVGGYCQACRDLQKAHYRHTHAEEVRSGIQHWRQRHPEKGAAYTAAWRQRHPERSRESTRRWRSKNTQRVQTREALYQKAHRGVLSRREMERYKADPAPKLAKNHRYRARKAQAPVVEHVDPKVVFTRDQGICQICHKPVQKKEATLDHIIPLSQGGEHSYKNVVLAHASCNFKKGNRVVVQQMRLL